MGESSNVKRLPDVLRGVKSMTVRPRPRTPRDHQPSKGVRPKEGNFTAWLCKLLVGKNTKGEEVSVTWGDHDQQCWGRNQFPYLN